MLGGKRSGPEILNYFRAAQGIYDLALQRYREHELVTDMALLRHIHSEFFRELDPQRGLFRAGKIQISGAKVQPPSIDIEEYVRAFLRLVPALFAEFSDLKALARLHVFPGDLGCFGSEPAPSLPVITLHGLTENTEHHNGGGQKADGEGRHQTLM